jgi:transcriptional regulator with XRE-family HTH domain
MVVNEMETYNQYQAAQFRVALLLKKYKFGAVSAAKYLGKPRGLVQSWMQIGNKHYLAKEKISVKRFEKILKGLRRKVTKENLNYFYAKRLLALNLPVAFVSNILKLPTSTVRSWKYGKLPVEIKKFFYDRKLIDSKFDRLLKSLKSEITSHNLEYFLSLELAESGNMNNGRRQIGGRIISQILTNHFGYIEPIPEKTISCWIDKKRKPWDAFKIFIDTRMVQKEFNKIVDGLTYQHITYHISKNLAYKYNWKYSDISKLLGVNKEMVRGWIKKGRGNPVAKTFVNDAIVQTELEKYVNVEELERIPDDRLKKENTEIKQKEIGIHEQIEPKLPTDQLKDEDSDSALERELIYHLKTIPTGVSSAKVLQSILIQCSDASVKDIERILQSCNWKMVIKTLFTDG